MRLRQEYFQGAKAIAGARHNDIQLNEKVTAALNAQDPSHPGTKRTTARDAAVDPTAEEPASHAIVLQSEAQKLTTNIQKEYTELVAEKKDRATSRRTKLF